MRGIGAGLATKEELGGVGGGDIIGKHPLGRKRGKPKSFIGGTGKRKRKRQK